MAPTLATKLKMADFLFGLAPGAKRLCFPSLDVTCACQILYFSVKCDMRAAQIKHWLNPERTRRSLSWRSPPIRAADGRAGQSLAGWPRGCRRFSPPSLSVGRPFWPGPPVLSLRSQGPRGVHVQPGSAAAGSDVTAGRRRGAVHVSAQPAHTGRNTCPSGFRLCGWTQRRTVWRQRRPRGWRPSCWTIWTTRSGNWQTWQEFRFRPEQQITRRLCVS